MGAPSRHGLSPGLLYRLRRLPAQLRARLRGDEVLLTLLAALVGGLAGALAGGISLAAQRAHEVLFALPAGQRLSAMASLPPSRAVLVPTLGGLALGALGLLAARVWPRRAVDPIEANALHGGRMSLNDSLLTVVQIVISNASGASVGLEAGYTQGGGAVASRIGRALGLRRHDLRVLVGCGAAGAIASAFGAPLTGAFYAFELVIGSYALNTLPPVMAASIAAVAVSERLFAMQTHFSAGMPPQLTLGDFIPAVLLGMLASLAGIGIMRAVTTAEALFRGARVPMALRPALGGLMVGALGMITPAVMSAGHGAMRLYFTQSPGLSALLLLFALKAAASAISLGAGFRGGLFFASLFLGSLLGKIFAVLADAMPPALATITFLPPAVYALIGMSAMATAIIGGPLTMTFLALESTESLPLTSVVLAASLAASLTTRRLFGYSFATWRFHLRGEAIRSPADIGWIRAFTVARLMRRDVACVRADDPIDQVCEAHPLGSSSRLVATDAQGLYAGILWLAEAHAARGQGRCVRDMLHHRQATLFPDLTIKDAIDSFAEAEADSLAVVESRKHPRVIGLLNEHYALRRYAEELDKRRRELSGE